WNWYITNNGGQLRVYENIGNPIEIETNVDSIFFDLPAGVVAYEVQIQHDPKSIIFGTVISNGSVKLQDTDEELGLFNLICSSEENTRVVIPINLLEEDTKVTLSIRTIGNNRNIIGQQTKILTIDNIPKKYALHFNYPNPFNPTTTIRYDLPTDSEVHLVVYDVLGREVKTLINESQEAGFKSVRWNGRNDKGQQVSAGMYFYRIRAGKFSKVQKMVLLK
ncbi:MAG: T9SS type A sorting domain-containing protein, partial [Bacteroidetes bacterium]|nr:T9SS type A sorting domain-containing protein [Bacteroidota bacterium]